MEQGTGVIIGFDPGESVAPIETVCAIYGGEGWRVSPPVERDDGKLVTFERPAPSGARLRRSAT
jgi:hypothetical protein